MTSELQADGLLPCPFCGSHAYATDDDEIVAYCSNLDCPAHEMLACSPQQWNTRTPPPQEAPAPVRADAWISPLDTAKSVVIDDDIVQVASDAFDDKTRPRECVYGSDAMRAGIDAAFGALLARGVISPTSAPAQVRAVEQTSLCANCGESVPMESVQSHLEAHVAEFHDSACIGTRRVASGEICHCTCHNDPLYCRECKECSCHTK